MMGRPSRIAVGIMLPAPTCCVVIAGFMLVVDPALYGNLPLLVVVGTIVGLPIALVPSVAYRITMELLGTRTRNGWAFDCASLLLGAVMGALLAVYPMSNFVFARLMHVFGALTGATVGVVLWALRDPPGTAVQGS